MCSGGGSSGPSPAQISISQQQVVSQAQQSAAQLAEQQREFAIQQQQDAATLANTKAQQAQQQQQADQQAALTNLWQTSRANEQGWATNDINNAFAQFTPDYYQKYTDAYTAHYQPQIDHQFAAASNQTAYGLARQGNTQSETGAEQFGQLAEQRGTAEADVNNQAIAATSALRTQEVNAKANLMSAATSDATLGAPTTPVSVDAISADFNNTQAQIAGLVSSAGNVVNTLSATPAYASLGNIFGQAAGAVGGTIQAANNFSNYQGLNANGPGAASPSSGGSGSVSG